MSRSTCILPLLLGTLVLLAAGPGVAAVGVPEGSGTWPLDPEPSVVRGFSPPDLEWEAGHRGVDLAGHPGQVVRASVGGTVGFAGSIGSKPVVTVIHGAWRTTYEPVEALVSPGDLVEEGQPIGRLLTVSGHCFPGTCLHWGLKEGDTYLDPLQLVGGGPVRLLPLWRDSPLDARSPTTVQTALPWWGWRSPLAAFAAGLTPWGAPARRPGAIGPW